MLQCGSHDRARHSTRRRDVRANRLLQVPQQQPTLAQTHEAFAPQQSYIVQCIPAAMKRWRPSVVYAVTIRWMVMKPGLYNTQGDADNNVVVGVCMDL